MIYYFMREIWTPLKWAKVRFFYCSGENAYYIKFGQHQRKRITSLKAIKREQIN